MAVFQLLLLASTVSFQLPYLAATSSNCQFWVPSVIVWPQLQVFMWIILSNLFVTLKQTTINLSCQQSSGVSSVSCM